MSLDDAAHCRSIVRTHARTFSLASHLLPPAKRRASYAIYAFCRVADDVVDHRGGASSQDVRATLDQLRRSLADVLAGSPKGPVFRELAAAIDAWRIPPALLHELLDGVGRDCLPFEPRDWADLEEYCQGVASSVGEMCTFIFGVTGDRRDWDRARHHARTLGVAMQLTNILRDVGEDAANGRCYLPSSDLAAFGLTREDVLQARVGRDARWRALMQFEMARARALYADATPGIALLAPDARRCATACATGYAGILDAIERIGYDTFRTRARLSSVARAAVLWSAWRVPLGSDASLSSMAT